MRLGRWPNDARLRRMMFGLRPNDAAPLGQLRSPCGTIGKRRTANDLQFALICWLDTKCLAEFRRRSGEIGFDPFFARHVRAEKHFSACQCAQRARAAGRKSYLGEPSEAGPSGHKKSRCP